MDQDAPANATKKRTSIAVMAALILAEIVSSFEGSMIYAALRQFYALYDDPIAIGWLVSGYMLVASAAAAVCGRLGDLLGRKRVLIACIFVAMCGSLISAASTSLNWIIAGRSLQGLAGAILPLCFGMVREYFPQERTATNIGIIAATASGGAGIGLLLGGVLVDSGSWRAIFICSAALAAMAIVAVATLVPPSRHFAPGRIDWIGGIMFVPGITIFLYGLGMGEEYGWGGSEQIGVLALGAGILAGWLIYESRISNPLIDVRMLLNRQIGLTLLVMIMLAFGTMNLGQIVMVMLQQPSATGVGLGLSATVAGLLHTPASIVGVIASPICGWYAGRKGGRGAMVLASVTGAIAWIGLTFAHHDVWIVLVWMLLNSFAVGALMAAAPNLIVESAPDGRTSEATGLAQIARKIAMAVGAQVIAILLATSTTRVEGGSFPDAQAYTWTYAVIAVCCVFAIALSLCLPRRAAAAT